MTKHVILEDPDYLRLRSDMKALKSTTSIAELALSPSTGTWCYKFLRADKREPNYIATVMNTFMEMAEAIEEEELVYRMMCKQPSEDDYIIKMNSLRKNCTELFCSKMKAMMQGEDLEDSKEPETKKMKLNG